MKIMRPPVEGFVPVLGFFAAEMMSCGSVALRVLNYKIRQSALA
jgi:hypothetical protein